MSSNYLYGVPSFDPMAMGSYQQFMQNYQQQNGQQIGQDGHSQSMTQDSGFSLVTPSSQTQSTDQQSNNSQNNPYSYGYGYGNNMNSIFMPNYSNDIFASQILATKPWEKYGVTSGTQAQLTSHIQNPEALQGVSFSI